MSGVALTCDRQDGQWRVALWQGRELCDLYIEDIEKPDLTGAVVMAKAVRLTPGRKAAWFDGGLDTTIYVERPGNVRAGDVVRIRITFPARHGKAMAGVLVSGDATDGAIGILSGPPRPWERAIQAIPAGRIISLTFAEREDHAVCEAWLRQGASHLLGALKPFVQGPVHPELDDVLETLGQPVVALPGGGDIVIEPTEALVAIDVNGGANPNPLAVNLRAMQEIARQIRLRDLSGMLVIDALKMKQRTDRAKVLNALTRATANDPAKVQVFGITKLGLIELTRGRRGAA